MKIPDDVTKLRNEKLAEINNSLNAMKTLTPTVYGAIAESVTWLISELEQAENREAGILKEVEDLKKHVDISTAKTFLKNRIDDILKRAQYQSQKGKS